MLDLAQELALWPAINHFQSQIHDWLHLISLNGPYRAVGVEGKEPSPGLNGGKASPICTTKLLILISNHVLLIPRLNMTNLKVCYVNHLQYQNQGTHRALEQQQEHMETKHESFHIKSILQ